MYYYILDLELTIEALKRTVTDTSTSLQNTEQTLAQKNSEIEILMGQLKASQDKVCNDCLHCYKCTWMYVCWRLLVIHFHNNVICCVLSCQELMHICMHCVDYMHSLCQYNIPLPAGVHVWCSWICVWLFVICRYQKWKILHLILH